LLKHLSILIILSLLSAQNFASEAIGSYTNGCLKQGVALPLNGAGYQVIRPSRARYYAHAQLIETLQNLGQTLLEQGLGVLLIADMAQAVGGAMPSGHKSHQIGLDVDILFDQHPDAHLRNLTTAEREALHPRSVLSNARWQSAMGERLKIAALQPDVARIFVNAKIKQRICQQFSGEAWLRRIRPWWGHDGHFHLRLKCPQDSPLCKDQAPPPAGTGCGQALAWWLDATARTSTASKSKKTHKKLRQKPKPLKACRAITAQ
jgi:penicillin-insensitive murein endopeptidase